MTDRARELREAMDAVFHRHEFFDAREQCAAIVETLGITEEDVKNARGGKHIPYPTHTNAVKKLADAIETLLEASR